MVFCVTRNIWLSQLKKFLKKHVQEGNIKPQAASFGAGQREAEAISYLARAKTTPKVLSGSGNWKLQLMGKKKCYCSGPYAPICGEILLESYSWQKKNPSVPQNTLWWVSTPPQPLESKKKLLQGTHGCLFGSSTWPHYLWQLLDISLNLQLSIVRVEPANRLR